MSISVALSASYITRTLHSVSLSKVGLSRIFHPYDMSFGFSVGDFIAVAHLATDVGDAAYANN